MRFLALASSALVVLSACTRVTPPPPATAPVDDAAPTTSATVDAAVERVDAEAVVDAATTTIDEGKSHDPCARCAANHYCLVATKTGGVQRPPPYNVTTTRSCEPLPRGCTSCACLDGPGRCEAHDGRIRRDVFLSLP